MFSLLNAVQVIPVACVDFLQQTLTRSNIHVPVLLKANHERMGFLILCGWVPGQKDPVCRDIPTEMLVCPAERGKLKVILDGFCDEIQAGERTERVAFLVGSGNGYRE
jgi:hypothetical protein